MNYNVLLNQLRDPIRLGYCSQGDRVLIEEAADAIEKLQKPKWIPIAEREPEPDKDVLIMVHLHNYLEDMMCYGRRHNTKWWIYNCELGELIKGFYITHWMPLPEPPKEET